MVAIQILTNSGETIEEARWEVPSPAGLQEGQTFSILFPISDKELVAYISKMRSSDCYVDRDAGKNFAVLSFRVSKIRHMLTGDTNKVETLCYLSPISRAVEQIMVYIVTPGKADIRLKRLVKGT